MQFDSDSFLINIVQWAWVALIGMIAAVWRKVTGLETRQALLEQANNHYEKQRAEDRKRDEEDRTHYDKRFEQLETLIKNGHG